MLEWIVKNPQNKIGKPSQLFLWHGRRKTWPIHFIDARLFIDRTDFHRQGKIWRWKNKIKINIICKKKSPLSMENLLWLWNVLSMKCPIYEMSYLWNVLSMKYLSMKCPIYEISFYEMSYLWNIFLWNVQSMKCPNAKVLCETSLNPKGMFMDAQNYKNLCPKVLDFS